MAENHLLKSGIYFDDYLQIRVLNPEAAEDSKKFQKECQNFGEVSNDFQRIASSFLDEVNKLTESVENEKRRALGLKIALRKIVSQRNEEKFLINMAIGEKRKELETIKLELASMDQQAENKI